VVIVNFAGLWLLNQAFEALSASAYLMAAVLWTVAGLILGALSGLVFAGGDTSLQSYFEGSGHSNKIMVAIRCNPDDVSLQKRAHRLIKSSGASPHHLQHSDWHSLAA